MAGVHVEHDALTQQAQRLAANKNELEGKLQEIQGQIQELVSNGFVTDSASKSFADAHERWNTAAKNCVGELETMGSYLSKASEAFKGVDEQFTVKI
jgi:WXG100 family type VII secretion target